MNIGLRLPAWSAPREGEGRHSAASTAAAAVNPALQVPTAGQARREATCLSRLGENCMMDPLVPGH